MLTCRCRLVLEVPIRRDRHVQRWPLGTVRLLVYAACGGDSGTLRRAFIEIIRHLSPPENRLFAYPRGVLLDDRRVERAQQAQRVAGAAEHLGEYTWLIDCSNTHALEYTLYERAFESVAFFWTSDYNLARALVVKASQAQPCDQDRYETALLKYAGPVSGFVFYSMAHDNLEILGTRQFVLDHCFQVLLPSTAEDPATMPENANAEGHGC